MHIIQTYPDCVIRLEGIHLNRKKIHIGIVKRCSRVMERELLGVRTYSPARTGQC